MGTRMWMLCLSVAHLKRNSNFKWIEVNYFFIGSVFNFSVKSKWSCMDKFHVFVYMLMRGTSLKQRILCIIRISILGAFSAGKKCAYTRVNMVSNVTRHKSFRIKGTATVCTGLFYIFYVETGLTLNKQLWHINSWFFFKEWESTKRL